MMSIQQGYTREIQINNSKYQQIRVTIGKQVDILISKNQVLHILYLKYCVYKTT